MPTHIKLEIQKYLSKQNVYYNNFSQDLKDYLNSIYPNLIIQAQWYLIKHGISELPICKYPSCLELVKWNIRKHKFDLGCCSEHNKRITSLKKYGTEHPNQSNIQKKKLKTIIQEKYGVNNIAHIPGVQEKIKQTNLEKYGAEYAAKSLEVRNKIKKTVYERYGVENVFKAEDIRNKIKKTIKVKYMVDNILSNKRIRDKINETNFEKYGSIFPMRNEQLQQKKQNTIKEKNKIKYLDNNINHNIEKNIEEFYNDKLMLDTGIIPLFTIDSYNRNSINNKLVEYKWFCTSCRKNFIDTLVYYHFPSCPFCFPRTGNKTYDIQELIDSIQKYHNVIIEKKAIDYIYLPEFALGIKVNGLYWNSEQKGKNKYYHYNNTIDIENNNTRLLQFYDKECIEKKEVVLSYISRFLGTSILINIHDIEIREISKVLFNDFIKINSFNDVDYFSKHEYGLYYMSELIGVVNFSNLNSGDLELRKFVIKNGFNISGNILKRIILDRYSDSVIYFFQDRRYYSYLDISYIENNGFEFQGITEPLDYYFKNNDIFITSSQAYKHIMEYVPNYNHNLTMNENLELNGFLKIWDCGKLVFKIKK